MTPAQKRTLADTLDAVLWQELMRLRRIIVPELVARPYATTMPYYSQWLLARGPCQSQLHCRVRSTAQGPAQAP